jgi:hypothetical protein
VTCRLYKVHEEDGKPFELEMSWICEESGWKHARVRGDIDTFLLDHTVTPSHISLKERRRQQVFVLYGIVERPYAALVALSYCEPCAVLCCDPLCMRCAECVQVPAEVQSDMED